MTVDELIHVVEELTAYLTMAEVRRGEVRLQDVGTLDDEAYATLVDFIKGDRPTALRPTVPGDYTPGITLFDDDEDDEPEEPQLPPRQWGQLDSDGRINIPTDRGGSIKLP